METFRGELKGSELYPLSERMRKTTLFDVHNSNSNDLGFILEFPGSPTSEKSKVLCMIRIAIHKNTFCDSLVEMPEFEQVNQAHEAQRLT